MNRSESKYFNTARLMNQALILLLEKKDFEYITVKEVCEKAGVNRSTFYLHYESMNDLLEESAQNFLRDFYENMRPSDKFQMENGESSFSEYIRNAPLAELYLLTPDYLTPYLNFVRENKRLFRTLLQHAQLFRWQNTYAYMFEKIFSPILDRYGLPEKVKPFLVSFYIHGIMAVVSQWLAGDCRESTEEVLEIIKTCLPKNPAK